MWLAFAIGWVLGSISLYLYVYATAKEAPQDECLECHLPECTDCPYQEKAAVKIAA